MDRDWRVKQRESTSTSRLWGFPSVRHASGGNRTRADYSPSICGALGTFDGVYGGCGIGEVVLLRHEKHLRLLELFEFLITILSLFIFSSRTLTLEVLCKINNLFLVKKKKCFNIYFDLSYPASLDKYWKI